MTRQQIRDLLNDPATHRLVYQVLDLAHSKDIVDAINDLEMVVAILKAELSMTHSMED